MSPLDWLVIAVYVTAMIGLSVHIGRRQSDQDDYFVGGRNLSWWSVGISTMATQTSAISFISIPAFVALKPGGGLTWLQYELAVPLAMIAVMVLLIPFFRRLKLVSIYAYLEMRYGPSVRTAVGLVFLISRSLMTGVGLYASAIVLSVCLGLSLELTILIMGGVTIVYDTIGGITAVVYSDVIQTGILVFGILLCIFFAIDTAGGLEAVLTVLPVSRRQAIDWSSGLQSSGGAPFWAFLVGGFFLYTAYYGTDQSQVQRELSARTTSETKISLLFNGIARFPLTILYVFMGMAIWAVYQESPELIGNVPFGQPDYMVPHFVAHYIPAGLRGLIFSALLAAAMSSLDSALNSLSATTMKDFIEPRVKDTRHLLRYSKLTTIAWGLVVTGFAFQVGDISDTVIESINKIGSAFAGPILATFVVGVLSRRVNAGDILAGLVVGVVLNLFLWQFCPFIHWMWWNAFGFATTAAVAGLASHFTAPPPAATIERYTLTGPAAWREPEKNWLPVYAGLGFYFLLMLAILAIMSP
ncbi:MAG: sodium/solute symporter [Desulfobacterales bacterium]|nr:sodium/solute symporter [Desulfobacterales bacterium]